MTREEARDYARRVLAARLKDLGHELLSHARELEEYGELDPGLLIHKLRDFAALAEAFRLFFQLVGPGNPEAAVELARNPHRLVVRIEERRKDRVAEV